MRILFIFCGLILASCATNKVDQKQRALLHLQIGTGHLTKGNYPEALAEFLTADKLDTMNPGIKNQLGLAYFFRGRMDLAESAFRKALEINPKFTEARNNLGRTLIELRQYRAAIQELQLAAQDLVYPEPEKTLANLGIAHFYLSEYSLAEKNFLDSLKLRRQNCLASSFYGRTLYELSAFEKAAEALDQAIDQCKRAKIEEPYYFSALSYMKLGQREQAVARLEQGLSTFPEGQYAAKSRSMLELLK